MCHDVLAAVVEVASGMKFSQYMRENIWQPLDMQDTGFADELRKMHCVLNKIIRIRRRLYRNEERIAKGVNCMNVELSENSGGGY